MRSRAPLMLVLSLMVVSAVSVSAQPANDLCANAEVIPAAGPFPHATALIDVTGGGSAGDPMGCGDNSFGDLPGVWYRFTPAVTAAYTLSTCPDDTGTTVPRTRISLYTSSSATCGGTMTPLPSDGKTLGCTWSEGSYDGLCSGQQTTRATTLDAGVTYYILVWALNAWQPSQTSSLQLRVNLAAPPPNDTCAGATPVDVGRPALGTLLGAANDYELAASPSCFTGVGQVPDVAKGGEAVHVFTAPSSGRYSFRVEPVFASSATVQSLSPQFLSDFVLYLAGSCPRQGSNTVNGDYASNRHDLGDGPSSAGDLAEEVDCKTLFAGNQVYVFVDDTRAPLGTRYALEVSRCDEESESNDTPGEADPASFGVLGHIGVGGDFDYFSLGGLSPGRRIFAMLDGSASKWSDYVLRVTTGTDTLEFDRGDSDYWHTLGSNVAGTPVPGEAGARTDVFLQVSAGLNSPPYDTLSPYRIYYAIQPEIQYAVEESEPNDTPETATVSDRNYFLGQGPKVADTDYYRFTAQVGDVIYVGLDWDPLRDETPMLLSLDLFDAAGRLVTRGYTQTVYDDPLSDNAPWNSLDGKHPYSPGSALLYQVPPGAAGYYYARVFSWSEGEYLLSIVHRPLYAKGDLDDNTSPDLVLRRTSTGANDIWRMRETTRFDTALVSPAAGTDWQVTGVDDFTGDQVNDLILTNALTGAVELWQMNGAATRIGAPIPIAGPPAPWRLSATGDFSQDGWPDLVWRNGVTQKLEVWTLRGAQQLGTLVPTPDQAADANWEIVAALDYNGDGLRDLLWYNATSGKIVQWYLDANLVRFVGKFTNPDAAGDNNWRVRAGGDYGIGPDGPDAAAPVGGANDVVWQNSTSGKVVVWHMDHDGNRTAGLFTTPSEASPSPADWIVAGPR